MNGRPRVRSEGVVCERVGEDLVLYDEVSQTAHSLTAVAASVWELCDGRRSDSEIAAQLNLEPALVERAIGELGASGLLDDGPVVDGSFMSRREAAKRLAKVGGVAFAAPMIYSVAIGPAMAAASVCAPGHSGCTIFGGTANGTCSNCCSCTCTGGLCGCSGTNVSCGANNQCCSGTCTSGKCVCTPLGNTCTVTAGCCSGTCTLGTCCLADGISCSHSSDCCSGDCHRGSCRTPD